MPIVKLILIRIARKWKGSIKDRGNIMTKMTKRRVTLGRVVISSEVYLLIKRLMELQGETKPLTVITKAVKNEAKRLKIV